MLVTRKSPFSGQEHSMELPVTPEQLAAYEAGGFVQDVFPDLDADQREFIASGITPQEWDTYIGDEPED